MCDGPAAKARRAAAAARPGPPAPQQQMIAVAAGPGYAQNLALARTILPPDDDSRLGPFDRPTDFGTPSGMNTPDILGPLAAAVAAQRRRAERVGLGNVADAAGAKLEDIEAREAELRAKIMKIKQALGKEWIDLEYGSNGEPTGETFDIRQPVLAMARVRLVEVTSAAADAALDEMALGPLVPPEAWPGTLQAAIRAHTQMIIEHRKQEAIQKLNDMLGR